MSKEICSFQSGISLLEASVSLLVLLPMVLGGVALYSYLTMQHGVDMVLERSVFQSRASLLSLTESGEVTVDKNALQAEASRVLVQFKSAFEDLNITQEEYLVELSLVRFSINPVSGAIQSTHQAEFVDMNGDLVLSPDELGRLSLENEIQKLQSSVLSSQASAIAVPLPFIDSNGEHYLSETVALIARVYVKKKRGSLHELLPKSSEYRLMVRSRAHIYSGLQFNHGV